MTDIQKLISRARKEKPYDLLMQEIVDELEKALKENEELKERLDYLDGIGMDRNLLD